MAITTEPIMVLRLWSWSLTLDKLVTQSRGFLMQPVRERKVTHSNFDVAQETPIIAQSSKLAQEVYSQPVTVIFDKLSLHHKLNNRASIKTTDTTSEAECKSKAVHKRYFWTLHYDKLVHASMQISLLWCVNPNCTVTHAMSIPIMEVANQYICKWRYIVTHGTNSSLPLHIWAKPLLGPGLCPPSPVQQSFSHMPPGSYQHQFDHQHLNNITCVFSQRVYDCVNTGLVPNLSIQLSVICNMVKQQKDGQGPGNEAMQQVALLWDKNAFVTVAKLVHNVGDY